MPISAYEDISSIQLDAIILKLRKRLLQEIKNTKKLDQINKENVDFGFFGKQKQSLYFIILFHFL